MKIDAKNPARNSLRQPKSLAPSLLTSNLIISVGEAKKLLGQDGRGYSKDEITNQIFLLTEIAQKLIKYKHFIKK